ncbi:MAG: hypothetical protein IJA86_06690 [Clostridia bacterium]|nr:hypothetical protein [Clostridia bacterium]
MKIAIVGSRNKTVADIGSYLSDCDEIITGGARGIDTCAAEYAKKMHLKLTEILPEYHRYGKAAPIVRNHKIVDYADQVIVFWDGISKGSLSVIRYAQKTGKKLKIVLLS